MKCDHIMEQSSKMVKYTVKSSFVVLWFVKNESDVIHLNKMDRPQACRSTLIFEQKELCFCKLFDAAFIQDVGF